MLPHWPEYLIEAALLGAFMLSASLFTVFLFHPASPATRAIPRPFARRALVGLAMGATAVALIFSPWGERSGAHMNPATTLAFWSLGKLDTTDALLYPVFQLAGGTLGMLLSRALLGRALSHPAVDYVVTIPGPRATFPAFAAEFAISFLMMTTVLHASNNARLAPHTGYLAGLLLVLFIAFEAPLSGMSINPARTLASAFLARRYTALWVYLLAPTLAMLSAGFLFAAVHGKDHVLCAKLHHPTTGPCIFHCHFAALDP